MSFQSFKNGIFAAINLNSIVMTFKLKNITFLFIFIVTFIVLSVLLSFTGLDLITSFSAAATSISNVGPGLGSMIGPSYNFYEISDIGKWLLSAGMLAGRLEFLTLIVVFNKSFWK